MDYENAFFWWILGFGCGLLTMLVLFIWERSRQVREELAPTTPQDFYDSYDPNTRTYLQTCGDGEPDAPGPPKVVAIPKRVAKKKPTTKKAR